MNKGQAASAASDPAKVTAMARARNLKAQARRGGLRFEAYLPPRLAESMLDLIAQGEFADPSEAVFVMLAEQHELEPHADLRRELLARTVQAAIDDPRPPIPAEEVWDELRRQALQRPEPAIWTRLSEP